MEESKGEVKHLLLGKFNEGLSEQQIEESIKQYANLVNLIPSMKAFRWYSLSLSLSVSDLGLWRDRGKDLSVENMNQGFTHVFESTFESTQGIAKYLVHPDHLKYSDILLSQLEMRSFLV